MTESDAMWGGRGGARGGVALGRPRHGSAGQGWVGYMFS